MWWFVLIKVKSESSLYMTFWTQHIFCVWVRSTIDIFAFMALPIYVQHLLLDVAFQYPASMPHITTLSSHSHYASTFSRPAFQVVSVCHTCCKDFIDVTLTEVTWLIPRIWIKLNIDFGWWCGDYVMHNGKTCKKHKLGMQREMGRCKKLHSTHTWRCTKVLKSDSFHWIALYPSTMKIQNVNYIWL